jgi:uncharacterized protein (UPF0332 family)
VKPEAEVFLRHADDLLARATVMRDAGLPADAARGAYLACFHASQALIFEREGVVAKTHGGVQSAFHRLTERAPGFDPALRAFLRVAHRFKGIADYFADPDPTVAPEEASEAIATAARFVAHLRSTLTS